MNLTSPVPILALSELNWLFYSKHNSPSLDFICLFQHCYPRRDSAARHAPGTVGTLFSRTALVWTSGCDNGFRLGEPQSTRASQLRQSLTIYLFTQPSVEGLPSSFAHTTRAPAPPSHVGGVIPDTIPEDPGRA